MDRVKFGLGILVISSTALIAGIIWKICNGISPNDDVSQLCRLVSTRRSKDDDRRLQLKRRREDRQKSPKTDDVYQESAEIKRQNTM
ncbi:hypothetical protein RRG08_036927 [Elysia crispata]|uniref:Uncharacterized protein n=1 Tax=Elysia crispata TaxID=231223 RepID=A0AAE0ZIC2_9GAST|nr:hypothetical protein RRG08_036927 [Elysia crispata]